MPTPLTNNLRPDKALIFRITHRDNLPWLLRNGLHSPSSSEQDPDFVSIGNPDLIARRAERVVPVAPGGTLGDYIPFYFTPYSPMLLNIKTGYGGIPQHANDEIVILVSSLFKLAEESVAFVFTDRHAYLKAADDAFSSDLADLGRIDFDLLRRRDFSRDPEDPGKIERYQAEALAHRHVPVNALIGIVGSCRSTADAAKQLSAASGLDLTVLAKPNWYF